MRTWALALRDTKWAVTWKGRTASGARLPNGKYKIVQKVRDSLGHTKTFTSYVSISGKCLYWHSGPQTKYADTGVFWWSQDLDSSVEYSYEIGSHGIFMYGGYCDYNPETGEDDLCGMAAGRHRFTLPSAAAYSAITFSVYGLSWEGMGKGHFGVENYDTGYTRCCPRCWVLARLALDVAVGHQGTCPHDWEGHRLGVGGG